MLAGDFNLILKTEDKNNSNINRAMMGRFRRFLDDLALKEIPLHGRKYIRGRTSKIILLWSDWTECCVQSTGRIFFQMSYCRVQPLMILTTVHSSLA